MLREPPPEGALEHPPKKAKVGHCPSCFRSTHVAVPPTYDAGLYGADTCMGAALWQSMGPWASRFLAARQYWNAYGALSTHWDWAASSLDLATPSPLSVSRFHEKPPEISPEEKPTDPPAQNLPLRETTFPSTPRDLSAFIVDDNSPPSRSTMSRLQPRRSGGRNLSVVKQSNFARGGHRLAPTTPSPKGGLHAKSKQELSLLFGPGAQDSEQNPPLLGKSKWDGRNTPSRRKSKSELYVS